MWSSVRSITELQARNRWKVEFFSGEQSDDLSSAYALVPLGEILTERKEAVDPQQHPTRLFTYVGLENVESHTGDLVGIEPTPGSEVKSRSKVFRAGDLLYGRLRPNLNKVFVATEAEKDGICSGEFYVLKVSPQRARPTFIRALLASRLVQDNVATWITGAALPRLQLSDLLGLRVPLPPIDDQDAVVAVLEACDRERRAAKKVVSSLPTAVQSRLMQWLLNGREMPSASDDVVRAVLSQSS